MRAGPWPRRGRSRGTPPPRSHGTSCFAIGLAIGVLLSAPSARALDQGMYRIETIKTANGAAGTPDVMEHCYAGSEVFDPHRAALQRLSACKIRKDRKGHIEAECSGETVIVNQRDESKRFTDETRRITKDPKTGRAREAVTRTVGSRIGDCK
jgi:hypothetical protein